MITPDKSLADEIPAGIGLNITPGMLLGGLALLVFIYQLPNIVRVLREKK
jgi:hypothetical protein